MALLRSETKSLSTALYYHQFTSRIHDIDAAGVMFFARNFYYAHDAYEAFLNHHKQSIKQILQTTYILPISHTEADFKAPIFLNEGINIELLCSEINDDKFTLKYLFHDKEMRLRTTVMTRHVCLDSTSGQRRVLPDEIRSVLA